MVKRLVVLGNVQAVGFRWFTRTKGRECGVRGWVKNLSDGSVEIVADTLPDAFLDAVKRGPMYGRVDDIRIDECDDTVPDDFEIRY